MTISRLPALQATRPIAVVGSVVLGLSQLGGCAGNGAYTTKFKQEAQGRMDMVKAGTQWDMANQQYQSGALDRALETIETSLALNDKVAKSHALKGQILLELGRLEPALASFDESISLDDKQALPRYYRGVVLERMERVDDALESYRQAAAIDRSNPQFTVAAAEMLIHLGRLDEAKSILEPPVGSELPRFTQNAGVRQTLGHIALMQRDPVRAIRCFQDACTLAPDDLALVEDLARAQVSGGRHAEAESNLARVLKDAKPDDRRDLRLLRARCLVEIERPVDARVMLQEMVQTASGASDPEPWVQLGNVALVLEDDYRLRESAGRVMALAPQRYEGYLLMGLYQRRANKLGHAAELLQKSMDRSVDDPTPAVVLSLVYQQMGQQDRARMAIGKALAVSPGNERAQELARQLGAVADVTGSDQD